MHRDRVLAVLFDGLLLCQAHRRNRRVREHHRRDLLVVHDRLRLGNAAEESVRQESAGGNGHGCELNGARDDVADGVDVGRGGALRRVDHHLVPRRRLHARRLQVERLGHGRASNGKEDAVVAFERLAVGELEGLQAVGAALEAGDLALHQRNPTPLHLVHQQVHHVLLHVAKRPVATDDQVDLRAEQLQDARELDGDVARADDGATLGDGLEVKEAIRVNRELDPRDLWHRRLAAHGNEHVVAAVRLVAHANLFGADEAGITLD